MATQPNRLMTVEEYLAFEETSLERHEFLNGEIFAMAGASLEHGLIASNVLTEMSLQLRNSDCRVRGADTRLRTSPSAFSYSDVVISCKPEEVDGNTLLNPLLVVEVLSKSTEDYDRGAKFERYRQIPSFREYLIIAQHRIYVEHHVRSGSPDQSIWTMREFKSADDVITLSSVDVQLPCSAIYANVEFQTQPISSLG